MNDSPWSDLTPAQRQQIREAQARQQRYRIDESEHDCLHPNLAYQPPLLSSAFPFKIVRCSLCNRPFRESDLLPVLPLARQDPEPPEQP